MSTRKRVKVRTGRSKISGRGVIATHVIRYGELINGRISGSTGFNHSCDPNVAIVDLPDGVEGFAVRKIKRGEELTVDYRRLYARLPYEHLPHGIVECNCQSCGKENVK